MDVFIGTIQAFAFDYVPRGWMRCDGQELQISQYQALFAIIGIQYGGNGVTTFKLPNLCGRMPVGAGPAPPANNLPSYNIGNSGGQQNVTLGVANLPPHGHGTSAVRVNFQAAGTSVPSTPASAPSSSNPYLGASGAGTGLATIWSTALSNPVTVGGIGLTGSTDAAGGGTPVNVLNPFLALNFCIAVDGIFPERP